MSALVASIKPKDKKNGNFIVSQKNLWIDCESLVYVVDALVLESYFVGLRIKWSVVDPEYPGKW